MTEPATFFTFVFFRWPKDGLAARGIENWNWWRGAFVLRVNSGRQPAAVGPGPSLRNRFFLLSCLFAGNPPETPLSPGPEHDAVRPTSISSVSARDHDRPLSRSFVASAQTSGVRFQYRLKRRHFETVFQMDFSKDHAVLRGAYTTNDTMTRLNREYCGWIWNRPFDDLYFETGRYI